jgi:hypothetical protein
LEAACDPHRKKPARLFALLKAPEVPSPELPTPLRKVPALNKPAFAYVVATAAITADAGPCHAEPASCVVADENEDAAKPSIGSDPGPANIRAEWTSGGNSEKVMGRR